MEMQRDPKTETEVAVPKELEPMPEVEAAFEEIEVDAPRVGIIMGSKNDKEKMQPAGAALQEAGIRYEVRVMSAHRDPEKVREYCHAARMRGLRVLIAGAGMSAALPGVAAAHTDLPVIGVPILGKSLGGLDALLSAVQMPPGVPVACVAIDGAKNAGLLGGAHHAARDRPLHPRPRSAPSGATSGGCGAGSRSSSPPPTPGRPQGRVPPEAAAACRERASFTVEAVKERERDDQPRRRRLRRRRRRLDRRAGALDPLRAHLLRRPRHRARRCSWSRPG